MGFFLECLGWAAAVVLLWCSIVLVADKVIEHQEFNK